MAVPERNRTHAGMGLRNRRAVLGEVALSGPLPRVDIAGRLGLTHATISRIARGLIGEGLVRELPETPAAGRPGRRSVPLDIDPAGGHVLGVAIGPSIQTVALADLKNRVVAGAELGLESPDDPDGTLARAAEAGRGLADSHLEDRSRLRGGFVMVSGAVDPAAGVVLEAPSLGWRGVPARERFAAALGFDLPLRVESMPAAVAMAEMSFGAGRGRRNLLLINCELGLSACVIVDGRPIERRGLRSDAIGTALVTGMDGAVAPLDRLAGGLAVLPGGGPPPASARRRAEALADAIRRDREGDPDAAGRVARAGRQLGRVIAWVIPLVMPEIAVIAGPLARSRRYVDSARDAAAESLADSGAAVDVVASEITGSAGGLSAPCGLAIREYLLGVS